MQQSSDQMLPKIERAEVRLMDRIVPCGYFFDTYMGEYLGKERCAVKFVWMILTPEFHERFLKGLHFWRKLCELDKGEYILPFWGACLASYSYPYLVGPWMHHGDVTSYVNNNPCVDRKRIIRRIAEGIRLLHTHEPPIVHGDIRGSNIYINQDGNPLLDVLTDSALREIEKVVSVENFQAKRIGFEWFKMYRWYSPELCSSSAVPSPASDIYSYSLVVLEIMTGQQPYPHIDLDIKVPLEVKEGVRQCRPEGPEYVQRGLDDKLWNLLTRCWAQDPADRPSIHEVIAELPSD